MKFLTLLALLFPLLAAAEPHRYEKDIAAFESAAATSPPPHHALLFIGDSTFTRWKTIHEDFPAYDVINYGFGGSETSDLLYFADRLVFPVEPRRIVIQEGGNDLHGGKTPAQFVTDLQALIAKIRTRLPEIPIVICSITPNPARWSEIETRKIANASAKAWASSQPHVQYVTLFEDFLGPDGLPRPELYAEDKLHPSHEGYLLRVKILRPFLGEPDRE